LIGAQGRSRIGAARSTIGLKAVMAVTGTVLGLFVIVHMIGNLKFFAGAAAFDSYAGWLRRIGEPALGPSWYLWVQRFVLLTCAVAHVAAAVTLTRRDRAARPVHYRHRVRGSLTTGTMRWGGIIIGLFIVYHLLDLSVGALHPGFVAGHVYRNVVADFRHWYVTAGYTVAVLAVGLHLRHGIWSAARSLGRGVPSGNRVPGSGVPGSGVPGSGVPGNGVPGNGVPGNGVLRSVSTGLAVVVTVGFLSVPLAVQTGLMR
jgi:succinate dehydrogenase / fumarate reductase cytochrome b subunit